jgi:hypothetical protein
MHTYRPFLFVIECVLHRTVRLNETPGLFNLHTHMYICDNAKLEMTLSLSLNVVQACDITSMMHGKHFLQKNILKIDVQGQLILRGGEV